METNADHTDSASSFMNTLASLAKGSLPATSARLLEVVLDRYSMGRRPSRMSGVMLFATGVIAGGAAVALLTPATGATMRKRVRALIDSFSEDTATTDDKKTDALAKDDAEPVTFTGSTGPAIVDEPVTRVGELWPEMASEHRVDGAGKTDTDH